MGRYVIRRLLQFIPVVLFTLFLLHYLTTLGIQLQGDPVRALFGERSVPDHVIEATQEYFGLDDDCLTQTGNPCLGLFVERLGNYAQGDFGINFRERPVLDLIAERVPTTARLALIAIIFEAVIGVFAGVLAGIRKDKFIDNLVRISTVLLISVPVFVAGVLLSLFAGVAVRGWLQDQAWTPEWMLHVFRPTYTEQEPWLSMIIPGLALGAFSLATIARLTRTSIIENLRADYVRTAKAKGLTTRRVVGVHTLRNSLIPVVTFLGVDFGALMAGAVITEGIFNVPGVGNLVFRAVRDQEAPVVLAAVTLLVLVFLFANLIVDILYAVLDPRIRYD
jgi:ABC-type dipeptide/oligopeptide/nickel transport system permease component